MPKRTMRFVTLRSILAATLATATLAPAVVRAVGVDRDGKQIENPNQKISPQEALALYCDDFTELAKQPGRPPFIGEEQIVRQIEDRMEMGMQTTYITGSPNAGKTAVMEYIAGRLPEGYRLFSLRVTDLKAGTGYQGSLETRIAQLMKNFENNPKNILFVDEFHTAMKVGDFMQHLKPLMARQKVAFFGATTSDEYAEHIEIDRALRQRGGKPIEMMNPTLDKTYRILVANKARLKAKYGFDISDSALEVNARLTFWYGGEDGGPRLALQNLEDALQRKRSNQNKGSYDKLKWQGLLKEYQIVDESLKEEYERTVGLGDVRTLIAKRNANAKEIATVVAHLENLSKAEERHNLQVLVTKGTNDFYKFAKANPDAHEEIATKKEILEKNIKHLKDLGENPKFTPDNILTHEEMAKLIAQKAGISDEVALESGSQKLARIKKGIEEIFAGNKRAVNLILNAFARRISGVDKNDRTIGNFHLDGGPGTGKTYLAKKMFEFWFGTTDRMLRIQMNRHAFGGSKTWGSGPGYKDSGKGGSIEKVRRMQAVGILLDEMDKAPQSALDDWHDPMAEGRGEDGMGRPVDFSKSMFISTGNYLEDFMTVRGFMTNQQLEAAYKLPPRSLDQYSGDALAESVLDLQMERKGLKKSMRDRMVKIPMERVTPESAQFILELMLKDQAAEIYRNHRVFVDFEGVAKALADFKYDANHGARNLDIVREEYISNMLAALFLDADRFVPESTLKIRFVPNPSDENAGKFEASIKYEKMGSQDTRSAHEIAEGTRIPEVDVEIFKSAVTRPDATVGRLLSHGEAVAGKEDVKKLEARPAAHDEKGSHHVAGETPSLELKPVARKPVPLGYQRMVPVKAAPVAETPVRKPVPSGYMRMPPHPLNTHGPKK